MRERKEITTDTRDLISHRRDRRERREEMHHGGARIYTEKILARITKTRRHEEKCIRAEVI